METEILNEILTLTVSKLFTGGLGRTMETSKKSKGSVSMSATGGSSAGSKMIAEMKSKYSSEIEEEKQTEELKQGYFTSLILLYLYNLSSLVS